MSPGLLTLAESWVHSLDPVMVALGPVKLRWYGLSYVLGFIVGAMLLRFLSGRGATPIPKDRALDVIMWLVGGVLIGGRLGYAIFYKPSLFIGFSSSPPFWDLLALTNGGMASHGGIIGVCLAAWRIARGWKDDDGVVRGACSFWHVTDLIALIATPGLAFGRLANFINGELLGRVVARPGEPGPWWAVRFWQEVPERWEHLPESQQQLIAVSAGLPPVPVLAGEESFVAEAINHAAVLGQAVQRGSAEAAEELVAIINARHPTQLYQAVAEGLVTGLVVWWVARRPRVPGLVGAWFLIVYGVGRIATEFVRLPDSHLVHERILGLSRGQWLSAAMVAFGTVLLWLTTHGEWSRRSRLLGWARKPSTQDAADELL